MGVRKTKDSDKKSLRKGLLLNQEEEFIRNCSRALQLTLSLPVHHIAARSKRPKSVYFFRSNQEVAAIDADETVPVLPLVNSSSGLGDYWLHVAARIHHDSRDGWYLESLNLKVFFGLAVATDKELRIRAEWDFRPEAAVHAQPHWHFHESVPSEMRHALEEAPRFVDEVSEQTQQGHLDKQEETDRSGEGGKLFVETLEQQGATDMSETVPSVSRKPRNDRAIVHYAMSSKWHESPNHHGIVDASPSQVAAWLRGCAGYLQQQLTYVLRRI